MVYNPLCEAFSSFRAFIISIRNQVPFFKVFSHPPIFLHLVVKLLMKNFHRNLPHVYHYLFGLFMIQERIETFCANWMHPI